MKTISFQVSEEEFLVLNLAKLEWETWRKFFCHECWKAHQCFHKHLSLNTSCRLGTRCEVHQAILAKAFRGDTRGDTPGQSGRLR